MSEIDWDILPRKAELLDRAYKIQPFASVVDLGGCWGVNGGYTHYLLRKYPLDRAMIVDGNITRITRERAEPFSHLSLIEGSLGDDEISQQVGKVDAAIMFDILLHQVKPDWNEFLRMWSKRADMLVIYNPNWLGPNTLRFITLGLEEFLHRVYCTDKRRVVEWFARHDEYCEREQRLWKDVHYARPRENVQPI